MLERGFERAQQLRDNKSAVRQFAITQAREILQAAGVVDPKLESGAQAATLKETRAPGVDLRKQTYELLSGNAFREPTVEERDVLKVRGYDIVLSTDATPLSVVVAGNKDHFWGDELDYVNARPQLRDYTPPTLTVALRSKLFLPDSFSKSQPVQLQMIETESQDLQGQLPDARAIMLSASTYSQADIAQLKETGEVLFKNRFARALDQVSEVDAAVVGRDGPALRLFVDGWDAGNGSVYVGAVPAVVFLQK